MHHAGTGDSVPPLESKIAHKAPVPRPPLRQSHAVWRERHGRNVPLSETVLLTPQSKIAAQGCCSTRGQGVGYLISETFSPAGRRHSPAAFLHAPRLCTGQVSQRAVARSPPGTPFTAGELRGSGDHLARGFRISHAQEKRMTRNNASRANSVSATMIMSCLSNRSAAPHN
jgi:hypothetical protein